MTKFEKRLAKVEKIDKEIDKRTRKLAKVQNNLGMMYYHGEGIKQNDAEALRWFTKAAEQGDAEAQTNLGVMYLKGEGVKQDDAEALRWFTKAAEQGDAEAQYWVDRVIKEMESKND